LVKFWFFQVLSEQEKTNGQSGLGTTEARLYVTTNTLEYFLFHTKASNVQYDTEKAISRKGRKRFLYLYDS
jgi:hypothetical protein